MAKQYAPRNVDRGTKGRFVTVALDERTRFAVGLAARKERRTVSSLIAEALHSYLPTLKFTEGNRKTPLMEVVDELWSPLESSRLAWMADRLPYLLTFEEEILWQLIQQDRSLWRLGPRGEEPSRDGTVKNKVNVVALYEKWDELRERARQIAAKELSAGRENLAHVPASILETETHDSGDE